LAFHKWCRYTLEFRASDYLSALFPPAEPDWQQRSPFLQGMRELGWLEGQNLGIERRWAARQFERLPALATELVQLKVDLIVAEASLEIAAVKKATTTIPVVMLTPFNAVETGLVASLAHPGANVTGMTSMTLDCDPKRLELLKETVPGSARIAVLWCKAGPGSDLLVWTGRRTWEGLQVTARMLGVHLQRLEAGEPGQCGKRLIHAAANFASFLAFRGLAINESTF
jgi:putative ABC transport system substrate-binding protein